MFRGDGLDRAAIAIVEQWSDFSGLKVYLSGSIWAWF